MKLRTDVREKLVLLLKNLSLFFNYTMFALCVMGFLISAWVFDILAMFGYLIAMAYIGKDVAKAMAQRLIQIKGVI